LSPGRHPEIVAAIFVQIEYQARLDFGHQVSRAADFDRCPLGVVKTIQMKYFAAGRDDLCISPLQRCGAG